MESLIRARAWWLAISNRKLTPEEADSRIDTWAEIMGRPVAEQAVKYIHQWADIRRNKRSRMQDGGA